MMKKTLQDVLNDIQKKLVGKELHSISGTALVFTISKIDNEKNYIILREWKRYGNKCIIVQQQMLR